MTKELENWLAGHSPGGLTASQETLNLSMDKLTGEAEIRRLALADVSSDDLMETDKKVAALYRDAGPGDPDFIKAFQDAPATGLATVIGMSAQKAEFNPSMGKDSSSAFNNFNSSLYSCPLMTLKTSDQKTYHKTYENYDKLVDDLVSTLFLGSVDTTTLSGREKEMAGLLEKSLPQNLSPVDPPGTAAAESDSEDRIIQSVTMYIYFWQISGQNKPLLYNNTLKLTYNLHRKKKKEMLKTKISYAYELDMSGLTIEFGFEVPIWKNWAEKIAAMSFTSLADWEKSFTNLTQSDERQEK